MNNRANVDLGLIFLGVVLIVILVIAYAASKPTGTNIDTNIPELTVQPESFTWGIVRNGTSVDRYITLTNTGNATIHELHYTSTCTVGTLTWNITNQTLQPNATVTAQLTFHVAPNAANGDFSFDITVTGVTH